MAGGSVNKKEQYYVAKLEAENKHLKAQLDRHMEVYREQLYELVELKAKREMVNRIVTELYDEAAL